jgi:hypothetical protein
VVAGPGHRRPGLLQRHQLHPLKPDMAPRQPRGWR